MRTIENDIPEELVELAKEAMALGLYSVNLGFRYMGSDFVSPIEWALSLHKIEPDQRSSERTWLAVTAMRGDDGPTAYIPSDDPTDWLGGSYWNTAQVREWLRESVPADLALEYSQSWAPTADPEGSAYFLQQWPLFIEGARSGWTMERKADWRLMETFNRGREERGTELDRLPTLSMIWEAGNSFYNMDGHPDNRAMGAPVSVSSFSRLDQDGEEVFFRRTIRPEQVGRDIVEEELSSTAPWFVRVAVNDEENEMWLHYPEALQDPEETVQEAPADK